MCVRQWTSCSLDVQSGRKTPVYLHWSSLYYQLIILFNWHHNRQLKSDIVCTLRQSVTTVSVVCSLVTSRLVYGITLLDVLSSKSLSRLQKIQNTAVSNTSIRRKKVWSFNLCGYALCWLPVEFRIKYKLLVTLVRRPKGRHHRTYRTWKIHMFIWEHCVPKTTWW